MVGEAGNAHAAVVVLQLRAYRFMQKGRQSVKSAGSAARMGRLLELQLLAMSRACKGGCCAALPTWQDVEHSHPVVHLEVVLRRVHLGRHPAAGHGGSGGQGSAAACVAQSRDAACGPTAQSPGGGRAVLCWEGQLPRECGFRPMCWA